MERISIQDIASILTLKSGLKKKDAERFATTMFEVVKDGLESDRLVKIKGFGTFKVIDIEARESVNVNTGERVLIEGHGKVTFTPDTAMKELVNKPFSQFETVVLNEGVEFDGDLAVPESPETADETEFEETPAIEEPTEAVAVPVMESVESEPSPTEEPKQELVEEPAVAPMVEEENIPLEEPEEPIEEPEKVAMEEVQPEAPLIEEPEEVAMEETQEENPIEEQPQEETEIEEEDMESNENTTPRTILWVVVALLACVASFAAGYFIGLDKGKAMSFGDNLIEEIVDSTQINDKDAAKTDTTARMQDVDAPAARVEPSKPVEAVESPVSQSPSAPVPAEEAKKPEEPKPAPAATSETDDKYAQMDGRVRTGAYRIVGTDYEVKVKGGETTARVAKRTLGPDMECYIEVYNGLKPAAELKEGQSLKIPKLELKKKLKKK